MAQTKNEKEMLALLRSELDRAGGLDKLAKSWGCNNGGFIWSMLRGKRPLSRNVLRRLGYRRAVIYIKEK
jgi:hypothetical protein